VGISIDDGAQFTNTPAVTVHIVWPLGATAVWLANDGGFSKAKSFAVAPELPWRLVSTGPERLPKTVYMRFGGSIQTFSDDIILDETRPKVVSATLSGGVATAGAAAKKPRKRRYTIRMRARDNVSGVKRMQASVKQGKKRKKTKPLRYRRKLRVRATSPRIRVRVRDGAGNWSKWKPVKRRRR
jgi:hypothetical protein